MFNLQLPHLARTILTLTVLLGLTACRFAPSGGLTMEIQDADPVMKGINLSGQYTIFGRNICDLLPDERWMTPDGALPRLELRISTTEIPLGNCRYDAERGFSDAYPINKINPVVFTRQGIIITAQLIDLLDGKILTTKTFQNFPGCPATVLKTSKLSMREHGGDEYDLKKWLKEIQPKIQKGLYDENSKHLCTKECITSISRRLEFSEKLKLFSDVAEQKKKLIQCGIETTIKKIGIE